MGKNVKQIAFQHLLCGYLIIWALQLHYIKNVNHKYYFEKRQ